MTKGFGVNIELGFLLDYTLMGIDHDFMLAFADLDQSNQFWPI